MPTRMSTRRRARCGRLRPNPSAPSLSEAMRVAELGRSPLTGWGRTAPTVARLAHVDSVEYAARLVREAGARGVVPRGLGRSYGDAAQNGGGIVLDMTPLHAIGQIDADGVVDVSAGVSLDQLIRALLPRGRFVPVTPGTRMVTIGGAVAADVHGKNQQRTGSFTDHVVDLDLLGADGEVRRVDPVTTPETFQATAGGLGLTGVVTRVRLRTVPVSSSRMLVETARAYDLDSLMATLDDVDCRHEYSVAWIDLLAGGRAMGRGVVTAADHAPAHALSPRQAADPLAGPGVRTVSAPSRAPGGLLNRATVAAFNEVWFRKAPRHRVDEVQSLGAFMHPLDGVTGWNRLYGPGGFVQYQVVVPFGAEETVRSTVQTLAAGRTPTFLAVLKRFGPGNAGMLSFPTAGWTLALDIPARLPRLAALLDRLDEGVVAAGGRTYLAKDSRVRPELLAAMYPRLEEFRAVRAGLDPSGVFTSDLARRLSL